MSDAGRQRAWDRYWESGALHSCPGSFRENYAGEIAAFWYAAFGRLTPTSRVLDLGTGNGPLPALMLHHLGAARMPWVHGIDLATPKPTWINDSVRERVVLQGGVRMEALPFADGAFDTVTSQYGFEYAERAAATEELLRVCALAATVALVCHHHGSRLVEVAQDEVAHIEWLLGESGLLEAVGGVLPYIALSGTPEGVARLRGNPAATQAREAFNTAMGQLASRAATAATPDALQDMQDFLPQLMQWTATRGETAGTALLTQLRENLRDAALRSAELIEHALDEAAMKALQARLEDAGFRTRTCLLLEGDYLLGWGLVAERSLS